MTQDTFYSDQLQQALGKIPHTDLDPDVLTVMRILGPHQQDMLEPYLRDIRKFFGDLSITARCGNPRQCVIAKYLHELVPPPEGSAWVVEPYVIALAHTDTRYSDPTSFLAYTPTPPILREFIHNFDERQYPELIDPRDRSSRAEILLLKMIEEGK